MTDLSTPKSVAAEHAARARLRIVLLALGARLAAFLFVTVAVWLAHRRYLFPDEALYMRETARASAGHSSIYGYANFLNLVFQTTGTHYWVARLINVVAGATAAVVVHDLLRDRFGARRAMLAALAVALWPSLILWSVVVLKDVLVFLGLMVMLHGAERAYNGRAGGLIGILGGSLALAFLRPYLYVVAVVAFVLGAAAAVILRRKTIALQLAAIVVIGLVGLVAGLGAFGTEFVRSRATVKSVQFAHTKGPAGDTTFVRSAPKSVADIARQLPRGILYSMLGPFPWQTRSASTLALIVVEQPLWYAALVLGLMGFWRTGLRNLARDWAMPIFLALGTTVSLGVFESNAVTALRERIVLLPILLIGCLLWFRSRESAATDL